MNKLYDFLIFLIFYPIEIFRFYIGVPFVKEMQKEQTFFLIIIGIILSGMLPIAISFMTLITSSGDFVPVVVRWGIFATIFILYLILTWNEIRLHWKKNV